MEEEEEEVVVRVEGEAAVNAEVGRGEEKFMVGGGVIVGLERDRARLRRECMSSYFLLLFTIVALGSSLDARKTRIRMRVCVWPEEREMERNIWEERQRRHYHHRRERDRERGVS